VLFPLHVIHRSHFPRTSKSRPRPNFRPKELGGRLWLTPERRGESSGDNTPRAIDTATLGTMLNRARAHAASDPFSNPILLFALDLTLRMDRGEIDLDGLESMVQRLTAEAFADRAERLAKYLGETSIAANEQAITALIEDRPRVQ
jgi:hypothetical protein